MIIIHTMLMMNLIIIIFSGVMMIIIHTMLMMNVIIIIIISGVMMIIIHTLTSTTQKLNCQQLHHMRIVQLK